MSKRKRNRESVVPGGGSDRPAERPFQSDPPPSLARLRLTATLRDSILGDLRRLHPFAFERIGFLSLASGNLENGHALLLGLEYHPVPDDQYVADAMVGARIGTEAIRGAIGRVLRTGRGLLHVHLHDHVGQPGFSWQDQAEQPRLISSFVNADPTVAHGMLVLSRTSAAAWIWLPGDSGPTVPEQITIVGHSMAFTLPRGREFVKAMPHPLGAGKKGVSEVNDRNSRQSFLGPNSDQVFSQSRIGIAGLGGGGSHVSQQLAHVGILNPRSFDGDRMEASNLNRLIGASADDVAKGTPKVEIARRLYEGVLPNVIPRFVDGRWQDQPELLRGCDIVIGCVDTFAGRHELEVACRRYLIPYIDIGMDVHEVEGEPPRMAGQVFLSMPGQPCMWCLQILDEEKLGREAQRYGDIEGRPQVVWPNGVLASTAVGIAIDLLTGWTRAQTRLVYLMYDGNTLELRPHPRLEFLGRRPCPHYRDSSVGDPRFRRVRAGGGR